MTDSVSFTKEQIATFVNADTVGELAESMIKGYIYLDDCDNMVIHMPLPRAIWITHLSNNHDEFAKQLAVACGKILERHKLESEKA